MNYSFVKDFSEIGACDVYIGAVNSGAKSKKACKFAGELLAAADEKRFSGKEGQLLSVNLVKDGKLITCIFAGLGENTSCKSVETAFASAVKRFAQACVWPLGNEYPVAVFARRVRIPS